MFEHRALTSPGAHVQAPGNRLQMSSIQSKHWSMDTPSSQHSIETTQTQQRNTTLGPTRWTCMRCSDAKISPQRQDLHGAYERGSSGDLQKGVRSLHHGPPRPAKAVHRHTPLIRDDSSHVLAFKLKVHWSWRRPKVSIKRSKKKCPSTNKPTFEVC